MANKYKSERYNYDDMGEMRCYYNDKDTDGVEAAYNGYMDDDPDCRDDRYVSGYLNDINKEKQNRFVGTANAVNTDDDLWAFYGKTINGNYYLMEDDGSLYIVDANPRKHLDDCWSSAWKAEHTICELNEDEAVMFRHEIFKVIRTSPQYNGFDAEIKDNYSTMYGCCEFNYNVHLGNLLEDNVKYEFAY